MRSKRNMKNYDDDKFAMIVAIVLFSGIALTIFIVELLLEFLQ